MEGTETKLYRLLLHIRIFPAKVILQDDICKVRRLRNNKTYNKKCLLIIYTASPC